MSNQAHNPPRSTPGSAWIRSRWYDNRSPGPTNGNRRLTTAMSHRRLAADATVSPTCLDNPYASSPTYGCSSVTGTTTGDTSRCDHANPKAERLETFTTRPIPARPAVSRTLYVDSTLLRKVSSS